MKVVDRGFVEARMRGVHDAIRLLEEAQRSLHESLEEAHRRGERGSRVAGLDEKVMRGFIEYARSKDAYIPWGARGARRPS
uniref:Uncharacterized protein n=1 Tax=Thermofilum pendens TaxID=2269 RepID=A0A7C3SL78_THEPE